METIYRAVPVPQIRRKTLIRKQNYLKTYSSDSLHVFAIAKNLLKKLSLDTFPPINEVPMFSRFKELVHEFDQHVLHLSEELALEVVGLMHMPIQDWDVEQALRTLVSAFDVECQHVIRTSEKERHEYVVKQLRRGRGGGNNVQSHFSTRQRVSEYRFE